MICCIRKPVMDTVRRSLDFPNIIGFFVDSEQYAVYPNIRVCYCDDCWERFLSFKGMENAEVDPAQRGERLESPDTPSLEDYLSWVEERFVEQYKALAEEAHALNPKFVFGKLPGNPTCCSI